MNYNEYIKRKLINIYFQKQRIGASLTNKESFYFLDKFTSNIKKNSYSVSEALTELFEELDKKNDNSRSLRNLIGEEYLLDLERLKRTNALHVFCKETPLKRPKITNRQKFYKFDMSVFSNIKKQFPWIGGNIGELKSLFNEEIENNRYIQKVFNQSIFFKDYKKEFRQMIFEWIEEKNYPNKEQLKEDVNSVLNNKIKDFDFVKDLQTSYSLEEIEIINKTIVSNKLKRNNSIEWSKELDRIIPEPYYVTQKETLARTIEQAVNGKHEQLSDRLTTPKLPQNEKQHFFEIIRSWQNISQEIIQFQNKQKVSDRIMNIRNKLEDNPSLINTFKLK